MKNWKNILLTVIAALLLGVFAAALTSPAITDEAYDAYWGLNLSAD